MSKAAPRSCLKPPPRNPWVAEDGGESSASSNPVPQQQQQQQQQQCGHNDGSRGGHDLLAHQYATPFNPPPNCYPSHSAAHPSLSVAHPSLSVAHVTLSAAQSSHSVSSSHTAVSVARTAHSGHGVVHSHTAHSLHAGHAGRPLATTAHSVHSVPGTLQQPWLDHQPLWSASALPGMGGVYTVGGDGSCPGIPPPVYGPPRHPLHAMPSQGGGGGGSSGQPSTSGGGSGWGLPPSAASHAGVGTWGASGGRGGGQSEGSRCERCHYYCFRSAQAAFVLGIVTGFSLLVAGGVFHRQHVAHLQVLVYIGAMVSLVCIVLLVIFCAMSKEHGGRRGVAMRFAGPQVVVGDPEAVPLRAIEANNPVIVPTDLSSSHSTRGGDGSNMEVLQQTNATQCMGAAPTVLNHGCIMAHNPHNFYFTSQTPAAPNHVASSDMSHHVAQQRLPQQRVEDECDANQRYNRIWKQSSRASSEAASKL